jgi:hypothetical protein
MIASLSEDLAAPANDGGSALSDNVVTITVLSMLYALIQLYVPL